MAFTHLHVHTEYSLLDGMCRIENLIDRAKSFGMTSVAITDHDALYGVFYFYKECIKAGIKPITGVEVHKTNKQLTEQEDKEQSLSHLTLIAKNNIGYNNLIQLVTKSHVEGFSIKPRTNFELLEQYSEGIICLSGCKKGELFQHIINNEEIDAQKKLLIYKKIFGDNFYIELQRHGADSVYATAEKGLIRLARDNGVGIVATNNVHYLDKDDAEAQEVLLCIQQQTNLYDASRKLSMLSNPDFYFKSEDEMRNLFFDLPDAIDNTQRIADMCNVEIPYGKMIFPDYPIEKGKTADEALREMTYERIKNRSSLISRDQEEVTKRIDFELEVIKKKGYATYFLVVQDYVNWAKQMGIGVGPGRGSAAGSVVSYILGITELNPFIYKLPFERFLNPERPTPPDVDMDFADTRRQEVIDYVTKKYGADKVAQIITFGSMESRAAVRDVARALGMSYSQGDRIAKLIPPPIQGKPTHIDKALKEVDELKSLYNEDEEIKRLLDIAMKVESMPRHTSVHAAGVIITDKSMTNYVALQRDLKEGNIITQFDMYCLDLNAASDGKALGLLKMDFLGLRNLSIIDDAIALIKKTKGITFTPYDIPLDDKKTYDLLSSGQTIGVFQLESPGMRNLAKELRPSNMGDVSAMVALYRPGPMDLIPEFIKGKRDPNSVHYLHEDLQTILGETYGILVYQEQVMDIAVYMASYTVAEADMLRMAMGKKKKELMEKEHVKFVQGAIKKGYKKELAEEVYSFMEKFAAYGFNKAHSACYAVIAYWTAYMKANYPVEYMTAFLTAESSHVTGSDRETKITQLIEECKKMGIIILQPDINVSESNFAIENGSIRWALESLKNVGSAAVESIMKERNERKFNGFNDFLHRVNLTKVNKRTVESLVMGGAFDSFGFYRRTLLEYYPELMKDAVMMKGDENQSSLFADDTPKEWLDKFENTYEWESSELSDNERMALGFVLTQSPIKKYESLREAKKGVKLADITNEYINKSFIIIGLVISKKIVRTKKDNSEMAFVTVKDETGTLDIVLFPKDFIKYNSHTEPKMTIIAKGTIKKRLNEEGFTFYIEKLQALH